MDFNKIIDLLVKSNISYDDINLLLAYASSIDLSNEENQRDLIRRGFKIAGKEINMDKENEIIKIIQEKGISNELFSIFR